ncbi:hypothetical protein C7459_10516 [Tumebacillus permanentifrigoris]|uniref:Uncharacterized protein n=2 Tax=Tumebacillus permanentifrigoris TaxID=378543 RepID=A0A316DCN4_9BACL|nr:hypothetical protein C7459_10516 [Tumebacillus permanentifrigoris]
MYQALKRIQRIVEPEGEFNIVSNDTEVVKLVLHRFKNVVQCEEFEFGFKEREEAEKDENRNKRVIELAKYLEALQKGVYSKREIREAAGIDQAHFSDYLKNERIVRLVQNKVITMTYRSIERL